MTCTEISDIVSKFDLIALSTVPVQLAQDKPEILNSKRKLTLYFEVVLLL